MVLYVSANSLILYLSRRSRHPAFCRPKSEIAKSGDYNLTGDRYREFEHHKKTEWPIVELGKICLQILSGGTPSTKVQEYWHGDIPWITSADILDFKNANPRKYITKKAIKESATNLIPKNNIIVVTRVGLGKLFLNNFDVCISQDSQGLIINKEKAIPEFLIYVLFVKVQHFKQTSRGSTIQGVTKKQLSSLKIPLPPLEIQEKIVAEIDGYQKIIDAARQIVENYKPSIKIDPTWPIVEINELCDLMTGGTPTSSVKEYYENGNIRWLVSGDIHQGEIYDCPNRITEKGMKNSNAKLLPVNSVLIALNGQGKTRGTVALLRVEATCNQSIVSMNPKNKKQIIPEYLYFVLKSMYQQIRNITGDKERSGLSMTIIRNIKIPLAPLDEQKQIISQIESEQKIVHENKKLIEIFQNKISDEIAIVEKYEGT